MSGSGAPPQRPRLLSTKKLGAAVCAATVVGAAAAPQAFGYTYSNFWIGTLGPRDGKVGVVSTVSLQNVTASQFDRVGCAEITRAGVDYSNCHNPGTKDNVSFPPPEHVAKTAFCYNQGTVYGNYMICSQGFA